uniref:Polycystin cation channel PKD1/PKD2 domain-containing protein n=1 Tax=Chromera velia CCMP2878 TaxID=1169474 RepID=A0A0G4F421_9ALVE|eukprot:Cvel_15053.t1-p1 / transcript=Cvel_15053.t1 / gene=Cvel_15053 / organism=Chromera_velia_CCMP2878 / gene_product=hypothetical protein / transcript_product=hypothetical protein / location=Cvel_scaffold1096:26805-44405(+) / protein_length=1194 / sequence_SO=supercontig / SO=protein_coding / is_pseudo=false
MPSRAYANSSEEHHPGREYLLYFLFSVVFVWIFLLDLGTEGQYRQLASVSAAFQDCNVHAGEPDDVVSWGDVQSSTEVFSWVAYCVLPTIRSGVAASYNGIVGGRLSVDKFAYGLNEQSDSKSFIAVVQNQAGGTDQFATPTETTATEQTGTTASFSFSALGRSEEAGEVDDKEDTGQKSFPSSSSSSFSVFGSDKETKRGLQDSGTTTETAAASVTVVYFRPQDFSGNVVGLQTAVSDGWFALPGSNLRFEVLLYNGNLDKFALMVYTFTGSGAGYAFVEVQAILQLRRWLHGDLGEAFSTYFQERLLPFLIVVMHFVYAGLLGAISSSLSATKIPAVSVLSTATDDTLAGYFTNVKNATMAFDVFEIWGSVLVVFMAIRVLSFLKDFHASFGLVVRTLNSAFPLVEGVTFTGLSEEGGKKDESRTAIIVSGIATGMFFLLGSSEASFGEWPDAWGETYRFLFDPPGFDDLAASDFPFTSTEVDEKGDPNEALIAKEKKEEKTTVQGMKRDRLRRQIRIPFAVFFFCVTVFFYVSSILQINVEDQLTAFNHSKRLAAQSFSSASPVQITNSSSGLKSKMLQVTAGTHELFLSNPPVRLRVWRDGIASNGNGVTSEFQPKVRNDEVIEEDTASTSAFDLSPFGTNGTDFSPDTSTGYTDAFIELGTQTAMKAQVASLKSLNLLDYQTASVQVAWTAFDGDGLIAVDAGVLAAATAAAFTWTRLVLITVDPSWLQTEYPSGDPPGSPTRDLVPGPDRWYAYTVGKTETPHANAPSSDRAGRIMDGFAQVWLFFGAFIVLSHVALGARHEAFKTLIVSAISCLRMATGFILDFSEWDQPEAASAFTVLFTVLVFFVANNVVIAVLVESTDEVQREYAEEEEEAEREREVQRRKQQEELHDVESLLSVEMPVGIKVNDRIAVGLKEPEKDPEEQIGKRKCCQGCCGPEEEEPEDLGPVLVPARVRALLQAVCDGVMLTGRLRLLMKHHETSKEEIRKVYEKLKERQEYLEAVELEEKRKIESGEAEEAGDVVKDYWKELDAQARVETDDKAPAVTPFRLDVEDDMKLARHAQRKRAAMLGNDKKKEEKALKGADWGGGQGSSSSDDGNDYDWNAARDRYGGEFGGRDVVAYEAKKDAHLKQEDFEKRRKFVNEEDEEMLSVKDGERVDEDSNLGSEDRPGAGMTSARKRASGSGKEK